jgi:hypothetical protein
MFDWNIGYYDDEWNVNVGRQIPIGNRYPQYPQYPPGAGLPVYPSQDSNQFLLIGLIVLGAVLLTR